ncbi:hypothetical protein [Sediminibacterium ginsengisoli]|uniref:Uncharacterized protein n=1 Tax=Sediminibacterium ginsengisoli TaxID=413434 RepID=A0A1T4JRE8_9BACT|nr:hypothetical protein [Sediminibacterium ginsengisoli]SJZ32713.1 hypothetical protein SAMN04488132_101108 [Sediminibacterium ginsengisoli]
MIKIITFLCCILFFSSCGVVSVGFKKQEPPQPVLLVQSTSPVILVDAADVEMTGWRKKKGMRVIGNTKNDYVRLVRKQLQATLFRTVLIDSLADSDLKKQLHKGNNHAIQSLKERYNSSVLIILTDCMGGFERADISDKQYPDGRKVKDISYNAIFATDWLICDQLEQVKRSISISIPHSRQEADNIYFAKQPSFGTNRDDLTTIATDNAVKFAALFSYR